MKKKLSIVVFALVLSFSFLNSSLMVQAAPTTSVKANYGVKCDGCGRDDCMTYLGMEQVGMGGTLYYLKYKCSNCGFITYWTLQA